MHAAVGRVAAPASLRSLLLVGLVAVAFALLAAPAAPAARPTRSGGAVAGHRATAREVRAAGRPLGPSAFADQQREEEEETPENPLGPVPPPKRGGFGPLAPPQDVAPTTPLDAPLLSFDGIDSTAPTARGVPDTNGEVGPDHFVQVVNRVYAVYGKDGSVVQDPLEEDGAFAALAATAPCRRRPSRRLRPAGRPLADDVLRLPARRQHLDAAVLRVRGGVEHPGPDRGLVRLPVRHDADLRHELPRLPQARGHAGL